MRRVISLLVVVPFVFACGGGGSPSGGGGGTTTSSSSSSGSTTSGTMGGIPGAGTGDGVDNAFDNTTAANGTPQTALPLGVTTSTMGLNVWVDMNTIDGGASNYFVFGNGSAAQSFTFDICFQAPTTAMTATLWKVDAGQMVTPPVGTWQSASGCVTTMSPSTPAMLAANAEYLFGLTATGGTGTYAA